MVQNTYELFVVIIFVYNKRLTGLGERTLLLIEETFWGNRRRILG